jgi:hypothetical protein
MLAVLERHQWREAVPSAEGHHISKSAATMQYLPFGWSLQLCTICEEPLYWRYVASDTSHSYSWPPYSDTTPVVFTSNYMPLCIITVKRSNKVYSFSQKICQIVSTLVICVWPTILYTCICLTTLWASTAFYRDSFTLYLMYPWFRTSLLGSGVQGDQQM